MDVVRMEPFDWPVQIELEVTAIKMRGHGFFSYSKKVQWISLFLQTLSLIIYLVGFFPFKASIKPSIESSNSTPIPEKVFDRLVFVVIDALRADFVYDEKKFPDGFKWLRNQLEEGYGKKFIGISRAPTVTLPRLKALTSGTHPKFLDLIYNLISKEDANSDSWVLQFNKQNRPVLHFGDDTWIKLFPNLLHPKSEGVHSFFVTDTVEVDRNVTNKLPFAFSRNDWDALSLHYLGVDHIGHIGGIASPLLVPKFREMDENIKYIYENTQARDLNDGKKSLIVIVGDHGMTDSGNHGGSSKEETETATIFLSPLYKVVAGSVKDLSEIPNIDQVDIPTTISLFLGLKIPSCSRGKLIKGAIPPILPVDHISSLYRANLIQLGILDGRKKSHELSHYEDLLMKDLNSQSSNLDEYSIGLLSLGILLSILGSLLTYSSTDRLVVLLQLAYGLSQLSSTFIEEEHEFWSFLIPSLLIYSSIKARMINLKHLLISVLFRMIRYWNSTGFIYQNSPDIKSIIVSSPILNSVFLVITLVGLFTLSIRRITKISIRPTNQLPISIAISVLIFVCKTTFLGSIPEFQRTCLLLNMVYAIYQKFDFHSVSLLFVLLLKAHNAFPILVLTVMREFIEYRPLLYCLLHSSFFLLGPCHLISSIDFSPAYFGQKSYQPVYTAIMGFLVVWAGPVITSISGISRGIGLSLMMLSITLQRHHISVWTVFAPRLIFESIWMIFYLLNQSSYDIFYIIKATRNK